MNTKTKKTILISVAVVLAVLICSVIVAVVIVKNKDKEGKAVVWDGVATVAPLGTGTATDPYLIESPENLAYLSQNAQFNSKFSHYTLTDDLDMGGHDWKSIGSANNVFLGQFNGNNHAIKNIGEDKAGFYTEVKQAPSLFGVVGTATILNLKVEYAFEEVTGTYIFGGLVKEAKGGLEIYGCGNITDEITFKDCKSIQPMMGIGGLVGYTLGYFHIENSYSLTSFNVNGYKPEAVYVATNVGGLVGNANKYSSGTAEKILPEIKDAYYAGKIVIGGDNGAVKAGNIIGEGYTEDESFTNCKLTQVFNVYDVNSSTVNALSTLKSSLSSNWEYNKNQNKGFPVPSKIWK